MHFLSNLKIWCVNLEIYIPYYTIISTLIKHEKCNYVSRNILISSIYYAILMVTLPAILSRLASKNDFAVASFT